MHHDYTMCVKCQGQCQVINQFKRRAEDPCIVMCKTCNGTGMLPIITVEGEDITYARLNDENSKD